MALSRRTFFKLTAVGATTAVGLNSAPAEATTAVASGNQMGVLVDVSKCIGCRSCEAACAKANGLPDPDWSDDMSYAKPRAATDRQFTVVNRYVTSKGEVYVKTQCMHCVKPACATGCITRALDKQPNGAVTWDGDKCLGCRYCMLSCPFDAPKFEYAAVNPKIQKCKLCVEKLQAGQQPACVTECGGGALTFGKRSDLLEQARATVYKDPATYVPRVYGAEEAGGTSWLYISPVPFKELGFREVGVTPVAETTRDFLTAVPLVLVAWPAMLLGLRRATGRKAAEDDYDAAPQAQPSIAGGGH
jgi:Fe-S-cluster-containing dehydrogenase component